MNKFDMFKSYKLKSTLAYAIRIDDLASQIGDMNNIGRDNVDSAVDIDKIDVSYYWNGFADISDMMSCILEKTEEDELNSEYRRMRMMGMLDACNVILTMIREGEFSEEVFTE